MKRATPIPLSDDERTYLEVFVRRGKANARTLTRARVLLKCDEGWSNSDITESFGVSDQTIRNVRQRYGTGGVEAVLTDKRQARRRQALSDEQAAHLIAITCSKVPDGHDHSNPDLRSAPTMSTNAWGQPTCLCSWNRWLDVAVSK